MVEKIAKNTILVVNIEKSRVFGFLVPLESQNTRFRELLGIVHSMVKKCLMKNGVGVDW